MRITRAKKTLSPGHVGLGLLFVVSLVAPGAAQQKGREHWVATWAAAPHTSAFALPGPPPLREVQNQTIRMIVPASIGGRRVRIRFSNAYGTKPLTLTAVHIAVRDDKSSTVPGTDRALTFGEKPSFTIPPGARAVSDAVDLELHDRSDVAVSVYVAGKAELTTVHGTVPYASYVSQAGNFTSAADLGNASTQRSWYWIDGIDVVAPADVRAIVAFGDSITDGAASTPETNGSWPSALAARVLAGRAGTLAGRARTGVLNLGISGNRVLHDGAGVSALARFDADVLSQPGVRTLIILEGINDIGFPQIPPDAFGRGGGDTVFDPKAEEVSADEIIGGLRQLIERARIHGLKVIGGTLTPYEGALYFSPAGEAKRQAVNSWIRSSKAFDGVIDFDAALRDPEHPSKLLAAFQSGDNLHPNNAGYTKMASVIDLAMLGGAPAAAPKAASKP
jgi:lysophospholipase L1-like esterase